LEFKAKLWLLEFKALALIEVGVQSEALVEVGVQSFSFGYSL